MTVVAFVAAPEDARPVVTWAGRIAASRNSELVVFYLPTRCDLEEIALETAGEDEFLDDTHAAVSDAVELIVRNRRARKGRLPRHAVSIRRVPADDQVAEIVSRVRTESPDLFVSSAFGSVAEENGKSSVSQIVSKVSCDTIVLKGDREVAKNPKSIVVATSEGNHDDSAIQIAADVGKVLSDGATVVSLEAQVGEEAEHVAERQLRSTLRELNLQEDNKLKLRAIISEDWTESIAAEASQCDLMLVGADREKRVPAILEASSEATIGVCRRAPRLIFGRHRGIEHSLLLPRLNPTDYADLYEKLQAGSRWNTDFIVMLSLAAAIATLGLLQNSPAVVIGSMLLAPLMTPMIGLGLALNQGNAKLSYSCFRAIGRGFLAALFISSILAIVTPGSDLTTEVYARTEPNILDLLIAVFSGAAAAYALARPSLAGTIAGVAIATALVPPLCSAGISMAYRQWHESVGALSLLSANVLAIILAAAATFRAMGLSALTAEAPRRLWVRRVVRTLFVCAMLISFPLSQKFMQQVRQGKNAPIAFSLTNEVKQNLKDHIKEELPGFELIFCGRPGVHVDSDPVDVGIILSSNRPLSGEEVKGIETVLKEALQNPDLKLKVACVSGWPIESSTGQNKTTTAKTTDEASNEETNEVEDQKAEANTSPASLATN